MSSPLQRDGCIVARGGYWTGPMLNGVQHGWRCEWVAGPFGVPMLRAYGQDKAEATAALNVQEAE